MQGTLVASATAAIFLAFNIHPLFTSLMLIRSAASFLMTYKASSGEWMHAEIGGAARI